MFHMLLRTAVKQDYIINNSAEGTHPRERLIHTPIVVLANGADAIGCPQELEAPKGRDEGGEGLTLFIEWDLMVPF